MVVVTDEVASEGAGPPLPEGLEMVTEKASPVPSFVESSVVWTVNVCAPALVAVKVKVPDAAV